MKTKTYTTANISDFRSNIKDYFILSTKNKSPLIITNKNEPVKVLLDIDDYEDYLCSRNKKFLAKIKKSREQIKKGEVYSAEEVFKSLGL